MDTHFAQLHGYWLITPAFPYKQYTVKYKELQVCVTQLSNIILYICNPILDFFLRGYQFRPAGGIKLNLHFIRERSLGAGFFHIFNHVSGPAAICHKWNHFFSFPVLIVQESLNCRCRCIPPRWGSDCNHVIVLDIYSKRLDRTHIPTVHKHLTLPIGKILLFLIFQHINFNNI